jgi:hypothetical protein
VTSDKPIKQARPLGWTLSAEDVEDFGGKEAIGAKLAESEASWKNEGHAPAGEVWGWLHFARHGMPPEAVTTLFAALEAQIEKLSATEARHAAVVYCRHYRHQQPLGPPGKQLTWKEAYKAAADMLKGTPFFGSSATMKNAYVTWERDHKSGIENS